MVRKIIHFTVAAVVTPSSSPCRWLFSWNSMTCRDIYSGLNWVKSKEIKCWLFSTLLKILSCPYAIRATQRTILSFQKVDPSPFPKAPQRFWSQQAFCPSSLTHTHAQRVNGDDVEKCLRIPWTHSLDLIIRFRAFHLNNPRTFPVLSPSSRWRTTEHFPYYQPDTWTSALPIFTQNPSRPFPVSRPCVISVHNIHSWLIYASSLSHSPLKAIPLLNFMPVITLLCIKHPIVCSCFLIIFTSACSGEGKSKGARPAHVEPRFTQSTRPFFFFF